MSLHFIARQRVLDGVSASLQEIIAKYAAQRPAVGRLLHRVAWNDIVREAAAEAVHQLAEELRCATAATFSRPHDFWSGEWHPPVGDVIGVLTLSGDRQLGIVQRENGTMQLHGVAPKDHAGDLTEMEDRLREAYRVAFVRRAMRILGAYLRGTSTEEQASDGSVRFTVKVGGGV
ncbi:MAG: hypothetical protein Q7S96_03140 [bacterium]|nr:hypothetical protein [bacterium]